VTDRPDRTESSFVVPQGTWQFELGWSHGDVSDGGTQESSDQIPETLVRYGLLRELELRVGWNGVQRQSITEDDATETTRGAGDMQLGVKVALWDEEGARPRTALLVGTSLPAGSERFSTHRPDPVIRLAMSNGLMERLTLGWNLGTVWQTSEESSQDRDTFPRGIYSISLGISAFENTGFFVEYFGDTALNGSSRAANNMDAGITHSLRSNLQLDFAAGTGLSSETLDWFLGIGVSFRLPH
jgi:hypothetical protein